MRCWRSALHLTLLSFLAVTSLRAQFTPYPLPAGRDIYAITSGPDGALWFSEADVLGGSPSIGRMTTSGSMIEYPLNSNGNAGAAVIVTGSDGALWFTQPLWYSIGRITTAGVLTEYRTTVRGQTSITPGPDGALWFTESSIAGTYANAVGRITVSGVITEYQLPTANSAPLAITAGPDGALWFVESSGNKIGRITTSGAITEFPLPTAGSYPESITAGPDGALWFTEGGSGKIGRITISGSITEYPLPGGRTSGPISIIRGPDGALWFLESAGIGRISTSGTVLEFSTPIHSINGFTFGSDGALWLSENEGGTLGVIEKFIFSTIPVNTPLAINFLNPSSVPAGGSAFNLTVGGSGFTSDAIVSWNGSALATTFLDPTELTAAGPASFVSSPGTITVAVQLSKGQSTQAKLTITPPLTPQCANIGGAWMWSESGAYTLTISSDVENDTETFPVKGTGAVLITQSGCSISYNPVSEAGLVGSSLSPPQRASLVRTGSINNNSVSISGLLAQIDIVASETAGLNITSMTSNAVATTGQVTGSGITLNSQGKLSVGGFYSINGQTGPFTETITATSTAVLTPISGPAITSVEVAYGGTAIAQNTWIAIKGVNLVPPTTPAAGAIWSSAPEFSQGQMPTQLGGVSVMVNNKPAFIYFYCSAATSSVCTTDQINALTPLDSTFGPVSIVVINNGTSSTAFTATMQTTAPAFLQFSGGYAVATHANGALLGPTTLYPGASTPARAGEEIIVYGVGFGLPIAPLVNGSSTQKAQLPYLPICRVEGTPAAVDYAGLITPGLYQLNLMVPNTTQGGDNLLDCSYNGSSIASSVLLSVEP
ncbi:MAG TPA: hypothetical protein VKX49_25035 [Bryobacteraceae bacterium]|nr:hypothetical protein [Bryobacteraceae bacterium]